VNREFTRYSQIPVGVSFAIAGIGETVTSVDRMPASATGNRVNPPGALCMMAALHHRIALLLNQSGKVPSLKAGESRGYKLSYCTLV